MIRNRKIAKIEGGGTVFTMSPLVFYSDLNFLYGKRGVFARGKLDAFAK